MWWLIEICEVKCYIWPWCRITAARIYHRFLYILVSFLWWHRSFIFSFHFISKKLNLELCCCVAEFDFHSAWNVLGLLSPSFPLLVILLLNQKDRRGLIFLINAATKENRLNPLWPVSILFLTLFLLKHANVQRLWPLPPPSGPNPSATPQQHAQKTARLTAHRVFLWLFVSW